MLAKQQYPTVLFAALVSGSLVPLVQGAQFPTCVKSCVRQSGCPPTDTDCMCKGVSKSFLSDAVVCMNQWCPKDTSLDDLLGPIKSSCDVPDKAVQEAASKAGFDTGSAGSGSGSDSDSSPATTSSAKASPTGDASKDGDDKSTIANIGSPTKVDETASTTAPKPTAAGQDSASSIGSAILSGTAAVGSQLNTASSSLLVAPTTMSSVASASASPTGTSGNGASSDSDSSSAAGGSSADDDATDKSAAATRGASIAAAVLAVAAAVTFGW
ncbi:hypothetical protein GGR52DRAFT_580899 [Hypoxylon sp. FL1284]|nr:hypothetical protein GGR52DRAFT_580899 [Hypoxylon sp. FL1284]